MFTFGFGTHNTAPLRLGFKAICGVFITFQSKQLILQQLTLNRTVICCRVYNPPCPPYQGGIVGLCLPYRRGIVGLFFALTRRKCPLFTFGFGTHNTAPPRLGFKAISVFLLRFNQNRTLNRTVICCRVYNPPCPPYQGGIVGLCLPYRRGIVGLFFSLTRRKCPVVYLWIRYS